MSEPLRVTRRRALSSLAMAAGGATAAAPGRPRPRSPHPGALPAPLQCGGRRPVQRPAVRGAGQDEVSVAAWEYYDQGCADDVTVRWNREALQRLRFETPGAGRRLERSTRRRRSSAGRSPHPILLAPAAAHMLVHPEGEVATARGAGAASATMVLSTNSNCTRRSGRGRGDAAALVSALHQPRPRHRQGADSSGSTAPATRRSASPSISR